MYEDSNLYDDSPIEPVAHWCGCCNKVVPIEGWHKRSVRPCCMACHRRAAAARAPMEKTRRARTLRKLYGIGQGDYDKMVWNQDGRCAICGDEPFPVRGLRLHVDHDHKTSKVRDLLCHACNAGLGNFRDEPERLKKAIRYLKKWGM